MVEDTEVSSRCDCGGDVWVLTGDVAPLSWWFSGGLVLELTSSGISNSLMQEIITVGRASLISLPSATLCISFSSLMCPTRFGKLAGPVGDFLVNST